jgi:hypothetical protein
MLLAGGEENMTFIVQANPSRDDTPSVSVADRVEALRAALNWRKRGYKRVQIFGDGRLYSLREFAGTIVIGVKLVGSEVRPLESAILPNGPNIESEPDATRTLDSPEKTG